MAFWQLLTLWHMRKQFCYTLKITQRKRKSGANRVLKTVHTCFVETILWIRLLRLVVDCWIGKVWTRFNCSFFLLQSKMIEVWLQQDCNKSKSSFYLLIVHPKNIKTILRQFWSKWGPSEIDHFTAESNKFFWVIWINITPPITMSSY